MNYLIKRINASSELNCLKKDDNEATGKESHYCRNEKSAKKLTYKKSQPLL